MGETPPVVAAPVPPPLPPLADSADAPFPLLPPPSCLSIIIGCRTCRGFFLRRSPRLSPQSPPSIAPEPLIDRPLPPSTDPAVSLSPAVPVPGPRSFLFASAYACCNAWNLAMSTVSPPLLPSSAATSSFFPLTPISPSPPSLLSPTVPSWPPSTAAVCSRCCFERFDRSGWTPRIAAWYLRRRAAMPHPGSAASNA